jgi:poly(3-hydroxybutyrate) depolymerase
LAVLVAVLAAAPARAADHDIQLVSSQQLDSRLTELTLSTPALKEPTHVRVLVPDGYEASAERYPVLYLLHGAFGNDTDWTTAGDAEAITAGAPLIVVMPDGGQVAGTRTGSTAARADRPSGSASTSTSSSPGSTTTTGRSRRATAGRSQASRWAASAR